jgi:hypothetical protein
MEHVNATDKADAVAQAKKLFPSARADGYRLTRVDYFDAETGRLVRDV